MGIQTVGTSVRDPREFLKRPLAMMAYGSIPNRQIPKMESVGRFPLKDGELKAHRPDLPMRLLRNQSVNWKQLVGKTEAGITEFTRALSLGLADEPSLSTREIVLAVIPTSGGWRKAWKFTANNGESFKPAEVLWRSAQVFDAEGIEVDDGIGVFRAGINKKCPFYLIGGFHDLAGMTFQFEHPDDDYKKFVESGTWAVRPMRPTGPYSDRLRIYKKRLPFAGWKEKQESGLEQYSAKNCAAVQRVFAQLVDALIKCGEAACPDTKRALFSEAMEKLNRLHERVPDLFETEESEQLCGEIDSLGDLVGLPLGSTEVGESELTAGRRW